MLAMIICSKTPKNAPNWSQCLVQNPGTYTLAVKLYMPRKYNHVFLDFNFVDLQNNAWFSELCLLIASFYTLIYHDEHFYFTACKIQNRRETRRVGNNQR